MKKSFFVALLSPVLVSAGAAGVLAEEVSCPPDRGAVTLDNVRVVGACKMTRTIVQGNIVVEDDASLLARGVRVNGSVQSEGATRVRVVPDSNTGQEARVNGDIQIKNSGGTTLPSRIQDVQVGGTILLDDNQVPHDVIGNTVTGDVQVFQNDRVVRIGSNTINGNLQCKENVPAPTDLGGNVVQGNDEDQCEGFDSN